MIKFILINILLISVGGILYIIARSLPRIEESEQKKESFLEKFILSSLPHKIDSIINFYTLKFLRRLKITILRLDNYLTEKLKKLTNSSQKKIDFSELNNSNKEN